VDRGGSDKNRVFEGQEKDVSILCVGVPMNVFLAYSRDESIS
jgi:hypothetical protein